MKKILTSILLVCVVVGLGACGAPAKNVENTSDVDMTLYMGDTFESNGVLFTLEDFCFAEKTDFDTYNPNMIEGSSISPNDGYIFGYLKYTIDNQGKKKLDYFLDLDIHMEYGEGYSYGESQTDYHVAPENTDSNSKDVDPLMSKTYHHIISNCPESIKEPKHNIKIIVTIYDQTCEYIIDPYQVVVNEGHSPPPPGVPFKTVGKETEATIREAFNGRKYEWYIGSVRCRLEFSTYSLTLTQTIDGVDYPSTGTYEVGVDKLKANYGQNDVYYGWGYDYTDGSVTLYLLE